MGDFRMPALGVEMTHGRVDEWLVGPGDVVHRGDVVAVVDTDKAAIEVEVWEDGVVDELVVPEGAVAEVGAVLATLAPVDATADGVATEPAPARVPTPAAVAAAPVGAPASPVPRPGTGAPTPAVPPAEVRVPSPLTRRLAHDLHVDLGTVEGTGPGGRVTRHDVEHAVERPAAGPLPGRARRIASPLARRRAAERAVDLDDVVGTGPGGAVLVDDLPTVPATSPPPRGLRASTAATHDGLPGGGVDALRRAVARTVARSNRDIPHYYVGHWVDVTGTLELLAARNRDRPTAERVLLVAHVTHAVARALAEHPGLNGHWVDDGFVPSPTVDLGIAVALRGGGLISPAIPRADERTPDELMVELRRLVRAARTGRLRGADMRRPSATLTSLGDLGVETVYGVVMPPQVVIVGAGRAVERPWVVDGDVEVRTLVHMTLSGDHRQSDGLAGARLLERVGELLARPDPVTTQERS